MVSMDKVLHHHLWVSRLVVKNITFGPNKRDQAKNEQSEEVMEIHQEFLIKDEHLEADNEVHAIR